MPSRRRASGKRRPVPKPAAHDLADAMEIPLARAGNLICALECVGDCLFSQGGAPAVSGIAQAMADSLDVVKGLREKLFDATA